MIGTSTASSDSG